MARVHIVAAAFVAFSFAAACSSDANEVSRTECQRLRDHLIDLRMETVTADRDQHRAAFEAAMGEPFVRHCSTGLTAAQLRCSLDASDTDELTACGEPKSL